MRTHFMGWAVVCAVLLAACGGGDDSSADTTPEASETTETEVVDEETVPQNVTDTPDVSDADRTVELLETNWETTPDSEKRVVCLDIANLNSAQIKTAFEEQGGEFPEWVDYKVLTQFFVDECEEFEAEAGEGTRENPWTMGDGLSTGEWELTLGQPYEAVDEVQAERSSTDGPEDGMEYWIVPIEATYLGEGSVRPGSELTLGFVSDEDNHSYNDWCPLWPDSIVLMDEIYTDAEISGNFCLEVPEGAPGLWTLRIEYSDPVFLKAE